MNDDRLTSLYAESERRRREAEALAEIGRVLTGTLDFDEVVQATADAVSTCLRADSAALYLVDAESGALHRRAVSRSTLVASWPPVMPAGMGASGLALREGRAVLVRDLAVDERLTYPAHFRDHLTSTSRRAFLSVPLIVRSRPLGVLNISDTVGRRFEPRDVEFVEALGQRVALALENARLFTAEVARRRQSELIGDVARSLLTESQSVRVLERIAEVVSQLFGAGVGIWFTEGEWLVERWRSVMGARSAVRLRLGEGVTGVCAMRREAVLVNDYPLFSGAVGYYVDSGLRHAMAHPMVVDGEFLGVLSVSRFGDAAVPFTRDDAATLAQLADLAALAIRNVTLYERAEQRRQEAEALASHSRALPGTLDPLGVARETVTSVRGLLGVPVAALYRVDERSDDLVVLASTGVLGEAFAPDTTIPPGNSISGLAVRERAAMSTDDILNDARVTLTPDLRCRVVEGGDFRACVAVPLLVGDRVLGVLSVADRMPRVFTADEIRLLGAFAASATLALQNAALHSETQSRHRDAEVLVRAARAMHEADTPRAIAERFSEIAREVVGCRACAVFSVDAQRTMQTVLGGSPPQLYPMLPAGTSLPIIPGTILDAVLRAGEVRWASDMFSDPRYRLPDEHRAYWQAVGVASVLVVPLRVGPNIAGYLGCYDGAGRVFGDREIELVEALADDASLALEGARLHEETDRRRHEAELLGDIARRVNASLDLKTILERIAAGARELCNGDVSYVALRDRVGVTIRHRSNTRISSYDAVHLTPGTASLTGLVLLTGRPVKTDDWMADPRFGKDLAGVVAAEGIVTQVAVPIMIGDRIEGVLTVANRVARPFTSQDEAALTRLAEHAAVAIGNAHLFAESAARGRNAAAVAELGRVLGETLDPEEVAQRAVTSARALLGTGNALLYRLDESGTLTALATSGDLGAESNEPIVLPPGAGVSGLVLRERSAVTTPDILADARLLLPEDFRGRVERSTLRSALGVPLLFKDAPIGTLSVGDRAGRIFDADEVRTMETLATQVVLALENARLYSEAAARRREAELLASVARDIGASLDVDVILRSVAECARQLTRSDVSYIALRDEDDAGVVRHRINTRYPRYDAIRIKMDATSQMGLVLSTGRAVRTDDWMADSRFTKDLAEVVTAEGIIAQLTVPIGMGGMPLGVLCVANRERRLFTDEDEAALARLAEHATIALHNADLFERRRLAEAAARDSERRYRLLAENSADVISVYDLDLNITYVSPSITRLRGYTPEEGMRQSLDERLTPASLDLVMRAFAEAMALDASGGEDPNRSVTLELEVLHKDGTTVWTETSMSTLRDDTGVRVGFLAVARNITERKQAEAQLRARNAELQQAQKMDAVGQLAGGIAHDFNNLLTIIGGRVELALTNPGLSPSIAHDLQIIQGTADRAALLTRQLLAFSRRQVFQPRLVDLNAVVDGFVPMLRRLIGEHLEMVLFRGPNAMWVKADPGQIEQVILNLVVNARDAMPSGGRLTLRTALDDVDGRRSVVLRVSDTGVGIDPAVQPRVFEPFFTTKGPGEGTGLGLATVFGIVTQSGGSVAVDSAPGRGSTFTITLPAATPSAESVAAGQTRAAPGGTETILVVEDEPELRRLTSAMLTRFGYTVLETSRPSEASTLIERHRGPVHLLLTDVVMPEMSGPDLARALRSRMTALKVLYMSGYPSGLEGDSGLGAPLLSKPFDSQSLLHAVRQVLDSTP